VKRFVLCALVLAGCGKASLGGDDTGSGSGTDAAGSDTGSATDAAVDDASLDASACANGRKLYLEFNGVTLTQALTSDSTMNKAKWLTAASSAVPPFRDGGAARDNDITAITDGIKARLAQTPIEVVTTRPAAGPYVMIAFGGTNTAAGGTVATIYGGAVSYHDCGDVVKNDLAWVSDLSSFSTDLVANFAIGAVGWGMGLDGGDATTDCMCDWANNCIPPGTGVCTLTDGAASSITASGETACHAGTQDELTTFATGFCQ
jgi:hypothetical protein